jgi:polyhydroxyalkanoate synthase subunit PhaC
MVAKSGSRELLTLATGAGANAMPSVVPPDEPVLLVQNQADGRHPTQQHDRDLYSVTALADITDRALHAATARFTAGISPAALAAAYLDWATHLAYAPGKRILLLNKALRKAMRFGTYLQKHAVSGGQTEDCIEPLPQDHRFTDEAWRKLSFNFFYQGFLLQQQWWHNATTGIRGVSKQHENLVEFAARQILDMIAPSNFALTNPKILTRTVASGGANLVNGWQNFIEDAERAFAGKKPVGSENFVVGRDVARTPGKVIYRNRLIELIQYAPATDTVRPEPILIAPAWIMKYYILDLSARNSLVRYLTEQGFTVIMISWKNPGPDDRDLRMEDYRTLGVVNALDVVNAVVPDRKVHAVGYCLGGTLLSIAAAAMARDGDQRLATLTLLAAQTDFTDAGEITLLIDESQIAFLEDMMWERGFLDGRQMAGAFQMLRSNDLIWSRVVRDYLLGEREPMTDLMAWNADATRMPYHMHSDYLRKLFLDNDLAEGRFEAGGKPVSLADLHAPIFAVGTERDHVAPWRSTYKINLQAGSDVTYLLTSGGHNAGIVSEPGHAGRRFRVGTKRPDDHYLDPDNFYATIPPKDGSWWPEWVGWLQGSLRRTDDVAGDGRAAVGLSAACRRAGRLCARRLSPPRTKSRRLSGRRACAGRTRHRAPAGNAPSDRRSTPAGAVLAPTAGQPPKPDCMRRRRDRAAPRSS